MVPSSASYDRRVLSTPGRRHSSTTRRRPWCELRDRRSRGVAGGAGARGHGPALGRGRAGGGHGAARGTRRPRGRADHRAHRADPAGAQGLRRARRRAAAPLPGQRVPRRSLRRAHARGARQLRRPAGRAGPLRRQRVAGRGPAPPGAARRRGRRRARLTPRPPVLPATAAALAVLAVLLAWPVPALLARADWTRRDPLVALVCWQAVGLAGGLSMIGALLVHGLAPWGTSVPGAAWTLVRGRPALDPVRGDHWIALTLAGVLAVELVGVLLLSWERTTRTRRRHRALLELVVQPSPALPDTRLLQHPAPVAFCIPGARPLLVLSSGMVAELDDDQLAAVVAHERAHLREHHHLLLLPFVAWKAALPVLPAAERAHAAVRELVEMRADDVALR